MSNPRKESRAALKAQAKLRRWEAGKSSAGRSSTITDDDMRSAYLDDDRRQKRRINRIGAINRNTLRELGAVIRRSK